MATKYAPLANYLSRQSSDACTLTFTRVEEIIGDRLPLSARKHRPWWGNSLSPSSHVQARDGWHAAGWTVAGVDMANETVSFEKDRSRGT